MCTKKGRKGRTKKTENPTVSRQLTKNSETKGYNNKTGFGKKGMCLSLGG